MFNDDELRGWEQHLPGEWTHVDCDELLVYGCKELKVQTSEPDEQGIADFAIVVSCVDCMAELLINGVEMFVTDAS